MNKDLPTALADALLNQGQNPRPRTITIIVNGPNWKINEPRYTMNTPEEEAARRERWARKPEDVIEPHEEPTV